MRKLYVATSKFNHPLQGKAQSHGHCVSAQFCREGFSFEDVCEVEGCVT